MRSSKPLVRARKAMTLVRMIASPRVRRLALRYEDRPYIISGDV
ncbi:MAG: hypothetical protein PUP93_07625 [Rhizonema sp. NSF051]|nr:hypothetical protein [Rhizonema sp. NSF051]